MLAATTAFRYHDLMARDRIGSGFDEPLEQTTAKRFYGARGFGLSTQSPGIVPPNPEFSRPGLVGSEDGRIMAGTARTRCADAGANQGAARRRPMASPRTAKAKIAAVTAPMKITREEKAAGR